tara:strand:+ start:4453 stop:5379 length:927 start_codon:yes stop_codon:yes gene_type:complete
MNGHLEVSTAAKINLHLQILGLRDDGYHELAMVMQSINLKDKLFFNINYEDKISLKVNNPLLSNSDENLVIKAARLLRDRRSDLSQGVDIYLEKNIPIGAGLAGGSSDAAATIKALNRLWSLCLSDSEIHEYACLLGSDVPFCLNGGTKFCFGRGEILEQFSKDISGMGLILIKNPALSVSTPWAYNEFKRLNRHKYLLAERDFEIERDKVRNICNRNSEFLSYEYLIRNDLQSIVSENYSSVELAIDVLYNLPLKRCVAMSGSGPSCFALYHSLEDAKQDYRLSKQLIIDLGFEIWCTSLINSPSNI